MFYLGGPMNHCTHVTGIVAQYSAYSEYNAVCTAGMALAHFKMLNNALLNKDPYVVTEQAYFNLLYNK